MTMRQNYSTGLYLLILPKEIFKPKILLALTGRMSLTLYPVGMMLSVSTNGTRDINQTSLKHNGRRKKMMNYLKLYKKRVLSNGKKFQKH